MCANSNCFNLLVRNTARIFRLVLDHRPELGVLEE